MGMGFGASGHCFGRMIIFEWVDTKCTIPARSAWTFCPSKRILDCKKPLYPNNISKIAYTNDTKQISWDSNPYIFIQYRHNYNDVKVLHGNKVDSKNYKNSKKKPTRLFFCVTCTLLLYPLIPGLIPPFTLKLSKKTPVKPWKRGWLSLEV